MLLARGLVPVRARAGISVRVMSTVPFRHTQPLQLHATQPAPVTTPVLIGCGLIGAYV